MGPWLFKGIKENQIPNIKQQEYSWSWTLFHPQNDPLWALNGMLNAHDLKEFSRALESIKAPSLNVVYGDNKNNIAWWVVGAVPIRRSSEQIFDGANGKEEYQGYYGFAEMPKLINPPQGYIVSSNQSPAAVLPAKSFVRGTFRNSHRYHRLVKLIRGRNDWSIENISELFMDDQDKVLADFAQKTLPYLEKEFNSSREKRREIGDFLAKESIPYVRNWDQHGHVDSVGYTLMAVFAEHFLHRFFQERAMESNYHFFCQQPERLDHLQDYLNWLKKHSSESHRQRRPDLVRKRKI